MLLAGFLFPTACCGNAIGYYCSVIFRLFLARWLNVLFGCFMVDLRICLVGFW